MRIIYILAVMALLFTVSTAATQLPPPGPYCCGSPTGTYWSSYTECMNPLNCMAGCFVCDFEHFGYNCEGYYGYQYSCSQEDDDEPRQLDVTFTSSCDGNVVTVSGGGNDAHVFVKEGTEIIAAGDTEDDVFTFDGCDMADLYIKVTKSGYARKEITGKDTVSCSSCGSQGGTPECTVDDECLSTQRCLSGECVSVPCECGTVQNHQCVEYECCSDLKCGANELCENHVCNPQVPQCTVDDDCSALKYCDIPAGAAGGSCKDVTGGDCGKIENHAFVSYGYECGTEQGCPSCAPGVACIDHKCVQAAVNCPSTGTVGDKKACEAKENGVPCANCDYVITDPSGKESSGKTDEAGNFDLPLTMKGTYSIALLKDGAVVKIIEVQAFPKAQAEETKPPTVGLDLGALVLVLFLFLIVLIGLIIYWRSSRSARKK